MVDRLGFLYGPLSGDFGGGDGCPPCDCDDPGGGAVFGAAIAEGYNGPATPAPDTRIVKLRVWEDTAPTLLRRVSDVGGYLDTSTVLTVDLRIFDLSGEDPGTPITQIGLGVEECLFASLQLDASWEYDTQGYNFRHKLRPEMLPEGGHVYRVEYTILVLSVDVTVPTREIPLVWELHTVARMGG